MLLAPERLVPPAAGPFTVDARAPQYAKAYEERDLYNAQGERAQAELDVGPGLLRLLRLSRLGPGGGATFPDPVALWLDATYEAPAQWEAGTSPLWEASGWPSSAATGRTPSSSSWPGRPRRGPSAR